MDAASTLRAARAQAGLTQAALALRSGTSQATVSAYEGAVKQPSLTTLSRLLASAGFRLALAPAASGPALPSSSEHEGTALELLDVLELAAELPTEHERELRYPRLESSTA